MGDRFLGFGVGERVLGLVWEKEFLIWLRERVLGFVCEKEFLV